jgi:acetyl-CoA acetyltransferase
MRHYEVNLIRGNFVRYQIGVPRYVGGGRPCSDRPGRFEDAPQVSCRGGAALVGIGRTEYFRRGHSHPRTALEMAATAILAALSDAGLSIEDLDGFAYHSGGLETALLAQWLGLPDVRFSASVTGGGNGTAGSVGLAAAAITSGMASVVVSVTSLQQRDHRLGAVFAKPSDQREAIPAYGPAPTPERDFIAPSGLVGPGQLFALLARRHMEQYGTQREHFAEVAISTRLNAIGRPGALCREPLTKGEYFSARMIADPLCLFDFCLESDGAVAVVTTSADRAKDLRRPPVYVAAAVMGGAGRWGQAIGWLGMPEEYFASSGHRPLAARLYGMADVTVADVDVALLYDHFTPMVLMQLEDYGFCPVGESGPFVAEGKIRYDGGSIPVNTHGGNLSEAYIMGMTHVVEGIEQIRGTALNQVADAEVALVTGGPAALPLSSLLLTK